MFSDSTLFRPDRRRIIATVCLALALAVGFLASPRSAEAFCRSASAARNLRIFTYNVHGIPAVPGDLDGNEDIYQDSDENRMIAIAEEILEDDPDIVALSEVWQEDGGGKATFIKMLAKRYPFSIRYVRGISTVGAHIPKSGSSGLSDSGLMLFSKDPFMKFSQNVPPPYAAVADRLGVFVHFGVFLHVLGLSRTECQRTSGDIGIVAGVCSVHSGNSG